MNVRVPAAFLFCLLAMACARTPEAPPPVKTDIGLHVVSFRVPEGWEHLNHGTEHRFHHELTQISAADLGPVTTEGYMRELRHAHRLFQDNRPEDASAHLSELDLTRFFPDVERRKEFDEYWRTAMHGGRSARHTRYEATVAWDHVLELAGRLPTPDLSTLVDDLFPTIETAAHRAIAERALVEISGRPGIRIETWDRLSHDRQASFLFVRNEENLFLLRMEMGSYADMKPAFESLASSLAFYSASTGS